VGLNPQKADREKETGWENEASKLAEGLGLRKQNQELGQQRAKQGNNAEERVKKNCVWEKGLTEEQ